MSTPTTSVIDICGLKNYLGQHWVHRDVNLQVARGEIIAIIGGSGCGKTTLLRTMLMLQQPTDGKLCIFGVNLRECSQAQAQAIRRRWGVMFQSGALFSSLTVLENVMFPLQQAALLNQQQQREIALLKILLAGLSAEVADKYPAQLSGGMRKRAALARALALDPELLFLDEPTAGLDPHSAAELDHLVLQLRQSLGLTFVIVTHDLDTLWKVPDKIVFLGEGRVLAATTMQQLMQHSHPAIRTYFSGRTGRQRNG